MYTSSVRVSIDGAESKVTSKKNTKREYNKKKRIALKAKIVADTMTSGQVAADPSTPPEVLARLSRDRDNDVRWHVALNSSTPPELLAELSRDEDNNVRIGVAHNTSTPPEVLLILVVDNDEDVREEAERALSKRAMITHQSG